METSALIGSERTFDLQQAILIYHERTNMGSAACAATVHKIVMRDARPVIEAGAPITMAALEELAVSLGRRIENALLPERVLSISMAQIAWWCPAARRRIWFNPTEQVKERLGLKKLNSKFVQHPALLFIASRDLRIFALPDSRKRPVASTKLFRAPYFNLSPNGVMCNGNVRLPDAIGPAVIDQYEAAFFNSAFSHSNWGHQLTTHPRGHAGLWQEMSQRKSAFPDRYLARTTGTVGSILKGKCKDE